MDLNKLREAQAKKGLLTKPLSPAGQKAAKVLPEVTQNTAPVTEVKGAQAPPQAKKAKKKKRKPYPHECGRLPHGAKYVKIYDATTTTWHASLTVLGEGEAEPATFTASASASFYVERLLDRQYRAWEEARQARDIQAITTSVLEVQQILSQNGLAETPASAQVTTVSA